MRYPVDKEPANNMDLPQSGMDRIIPRKKWTRRRILWWGGLAALSLAVIGFFIFADTRSTLNVDQERITIATVTQAPFLEFIPITGAVQPIKSVYMDAQIGRAHV